MTKSEKLIQFVLNGEFSQENIDAFLISSKITRQQLISRSFLLIKRIILILKIDEDYSEYYEYLNKVIDLISVLCETCIFGKKDVEINRNRIKTNREALLAKANELDDYNLLLIANRLDELILDKNLSVPDLILLVKSLINNKENVNVIKKIININKNSILENSELFDYTFNLALKAVKSGNRDQFYYITLLKIFYSSVIDKDYYVYKLIDTIDLRNKFANEIYMILYGVKRPLTPEKILNKYEIIRNLPYIYIKEPTFSTSDSYLLTLDDSVTNIREDAISIRRDGNLYIIGIHISDVASKIAPNSQVDMAALNNFESKFLVGDARNSLFHKDIIKKLSLNEGNYRTVLTLNIVLNEYGEVKDYYFASENQKIARNLTYAEGDRLIDRKNSHEEGQMLYDLYKITHALESQNVDRLKYWRIKDLSHNDLSKNSKSHTIVSQCMILYDTMMANTAREKGSPFVYKIQDPEYISYLIEQAHIVVNEYTNNLIKDIFLESQYSDTPRRHNGLNTDCICQATDPLRKHPDFYNQQLFHHFVLEDMPLDFNLELHKRMINYYNQRKEEISLMAAEYNRQMNLTRKL